MSVAKRTIIEVKDKLKDETIVEMVTTKNDVGKIILLSYEILSGSKTDSARLFIKFDDVKLNRWSYVMEGCTEFAFGKRYFVGIPNSKVKMWQFTKTSNDFMITCNDIKIMDFNFKADSFKKFQESSKKWSERPIAIEIASQFSEHTFVKVT